MKNIISTDFIIILLVSSFLFCSFLLFAPQINNYIEDQNKHSEKLRKENEEYYGEEVINMRYSKVVIDGHQYIEEYAMLGNVLSRTHCPDCKYCKN